MEFRYRHQEESYSVRIIQKDGAYELHIGERQYVVSAREVDAHTLDLLIDNRYVRVKHAAEGTGRWVALGGAPFNATRLLHRRKQRARGEGNGSLSATMPGQVREVYIAKGDSVSAGQALVLMEAMKMEMRIVAPADGTITQVHVSAGEQVERGQILVEMAAAKEQA